jgi:hypothetical protein
LEFIRKEKDINMSDEVGETNGGGINDPVDVIIDKLLR